MSSSTSSIICQIPPVTRFLSGSLLGISMLYMFEIVSYNKLIYRFHTALQNYQVWRLYTSFFVGRSDLFFLFELFMLHHTSHHLESNSDSADFAWQLLFACIAIMIPCHLLSTSVFLHPLLHCLAYLLFARTPPGRHLSAYGIVSLPALYLPYTMLLIEVLIGGRNATLQALVGVAVGYAWWRVVQGSRKRARAPTWVRNMALKIADGIAQCRRANHHWGPGQTLGGRRGLNE